jgi:hypothetical protein
MHAGRGFFTIASLRMEGDTPAAPPLRAVERQRRGRLNGLGLESHNGNWVSRRPPRVAVTAFGTFRRGRA